MPDIGFCSRSIQLQLGRAAISLGQPKWLVLDIPEGDEKRLNSIYGLILLE